MLAREPEINTEIERESLIAALVGAAKVQDWEKVDEIAPQFASHDGDLMVVSLNKLIDDKDENVRDAVMTAWSFLNPISPHRRLKHFVLAAEVLERDEHECAAIWAGVTAARYLRDREFGVQAKRALRKLERKISFMDSKEQGFEWIRTRDYIVEETKERVPNLGKFI